MIKPTFEIHQSMYNETSKTGPKFEGETSYFS